MPSHWQPPPEGSAQQNRGAGAAAATSPSTNPTQERPTEQGGGKRRQRHGHGTRCSGQLPAARFLKKKMTRETKPEDSAGAAAPMIGEGRLTSGLRPAAACAMLVLGS